MMLFCVEQWWRPEWGKSVLRFRKYFTANSRETLESVLRDRYGKLEQYNHYEEGKEVIEIEECEFEEL